MTFHAYGRLCAAALCLLNLGAAQAKDDGSDPSITIEREVQSNVINADGSFVLTEDFAVRLNEDRAVKANGQRSIGYNSTLETLEIVQAYTEKPDGRKVAVQPDQIKDQQERQSADAPMFQDTRVKVVIFPEVAVGDRLVMQVRRTRATALFPGQYDDLTVAPFNPSKQFTLIYDLPAGMTLNADAVGFEASHPAAATGRTIYRWDYVPADKARIEQGSVSYFDYGQRLAVSTFADYAALARAYEAGAAGKTAATPRIKALASKLTTGLSDPRAKAFAIDDWVRQNIRYVAVYVGAGGVVPHAADTVLDNLYGDCKDHVALMEALLDAAGIESTPALINLGNSYKLATAPTLGLLNHVITYVPGLNLYLDSTAQPIAPGYLPLVELDKPVVLTKPASLGHTPASQRSEVGNTLDVVVTPGGAGDFVSASTTTGWATDLNRFVFRNLKAADRDAFVERLLKAHGRKGSGTLDLGDLSATGDRYEVKMTGHIDELLDLPGPVGLAAISSFAGGIAQNAVGFISEKERTQPFTCLSGSADEQASFRFPKEIRVVAVPKPVSVNAAHLEYTADYQQQGDTLRIRRHYRFDHAGAVCSPDEFQALRAGLDAMTRDLRAQIIVEAQ